MTFDEKVTDFLNREELALTVYSTPYADEGNMISVGYVKDNMTNLLTEGKTFKDAMNKFIDRYEETELKTYELRLSKKEYLKLMDILDRSIKFFDTYGTVEQSCFLSLIVDDLKRAHSEIED